MRIPGGVIVVCLVAAAATAWTADDVQTRPGGRVLLAHTQSVRSVQVRPDGSEILSVAFDGAVRAWALPGLQRTWALPPGDKPAYWAQMSADGSVGVAHAGGQEVRFWSGSGAEAHTRTLGGGLPWTGALSPDGRWLLTGTSSGSLTLHAREGPEGTREIPLGVSVGWVAASPDGRTFAAGCDDGGVRLIDAESGQVSRTLTGHTAGIYDVAFSADGALLASGSGDRTVRVWNVSEGKQLLSLPHFGRVYAVAFSPDGRALATGGPDWTVRIFDIPDGAVRTRLTGAKADVWDLAFVPDGSQVVAGCGDGTLLVLDVPAHPLPSYSALPPRVDLRARLARYGLGVVAQRTRGTCSLHTMARAIEFALSRRERRGVPLSDEYLNWATNQVIGNVGPQAVDRGQFFEHTWMGLMRHGICRRDKMPWTERFEPANQPSGPAHKDAEVMARTTFSWRDLSGPGIAPAQVVRNVKTVLLAGWPVLAGSGHSLLIVGYEDDATSQGGGRFIVEDSAVGGFLDQVTGNAFHSAIPYGRVTDYGFHWIFARPPMPRIDGLR